MYFHGILININWGGTEGVVLQSFTFASDRFWKSLLPYHPKHSVSNVVHSVFPSRRNFNSNRPPLSTESDVLNQHTANLYSVSELNLTKKKKEEMEYTEIETNAVTLDNSVIFHVIKDVIGFVLYMHQQIPS